MDDNLRKYNVEISRLFSIGVEVLNGARSLKVISRQLKHLAVNGIIQATKVNSRQGQSLITLSGFLSGLPKQIAPELVELEKLSADLSRRITICSINVKRFISYTTALYQMLASVIENKKGRFRATDLNLIKSQELFKLSKGEYINSAEEILRHNIKMLASKNLELIQSINDSLFEINDEITRASNRVERVSRNGFIANYMGSYISIESAYLSTDKRNFIGLVNNIQQMVGDLNKNLDAILESIREGSQILGLLTKTGLTI